MKKHIVFLLIVIFISSFFMMADEKQDLWKKIGTEANLQTKFNLLQEYESKFGQIQDETTKFLYLNMALTSYQLKQFDKTIIYGEKAIAQTDLDNQNKLNLALWLANSFNVTKTDLQKSYDYAERVIITAKELKGNDQPSAKYDRKYIAPALRIQIQTLYARGKSNPEMMVKAAQKALDAYSFESVRKNADMVFSLSNILYKMKKVSQAIGFMEKMIQAEPRNSRYINSIAIWYSKIGNKDKAVMYLEKSYQIRRNVKTAYNIAVLSQSKNVDKAIKYLSEAYQMNPSKQSRVYKLLRHLYYNVKAKDKTQEEQDQGFQDVLNAARSRVGK